MVNSRSLKDLRSDVRENCEIFLELCKSAGLKVLVTQTLRDNEYQASLYALGRTKPGKIVTNSKTTTFHGVGLAFDICKNVRGHEYDDLAFFKKCGEIGKQVGFTWGGDWKSFPDRPHFQWDNNRKNLNYKSVPAMPKYEEEVMDVSKLTDKECYEILLKAQKHAATLPVSSWAKNDWEKSKNDKITDGSAPQKLATRQEISIMLNRK